jgi:hypothetical protein
MAKRNRQSRNRRVKMNKSKSVDYWTFVTSTAATVSDWPDWKRGTADVRRERAVITAEQPKKIAAPSAADANQVVREPKSMPKIDLK